MKTGFLFVLFCFFLLLFGFSLLIFVSVMYSQIQNLIFRYKQGEILLHTATIKINLSFIPKQIMSSNIEVTRICQFCSSSFTAKTTVTKYCSHRCASRAYKARQRGNDVAKSNEETAVKISAPIVELQTKDFLSVSDASALLGVSRWTLSRAISSGRLNIVRFGKRIVIKRSEIDRMFS